MTLRRRADRRCRAISSPTTPGLCCRHGAATWRWSSSPRRARSATISASRAARAMARPPSACTPFRCRLPAIGGSLQGADLVVPADPARPRRCVDPRIKQRSRMHWWLADQEASTHRTRRLRLAARRRGPRHRNGSRQLPDGPPWRGAVAAARLVLRASACWSSRSCAASWAFRFEEQPLQSVSA